MSDVSCRVFAFFEKVADGHGFAVSELTDGLPMTLDELREPTAFAPWPVWAELCERLEARIGPEAARNAGATMQDLPLSDGVRSLLGGIVEAPLLYRAITGWLAPSLFRHATFETRVHSSTRVTVTIEIPPHLPGCVAWFRIAEGSFIVVPEMLGHAPAACSATLEPHRAVFRLTIEERRSAVGGVRRRLESLLRPNRVIDDLQAMQQELRRAYEDARSGASDLHAVLTALPEPVLVLAGGRVAFANEAWRRLPLAGPDDAPFRDFGEAARGVLEGHDGTEVRAIEVNLADGVPTVFEVPPPVSVRHGDQSARLFLLRDVTEARARADRIALTDRLSSLGTLAACVGHEINNPLTYVVSSLELLADELDEMDRAAMAPAVRDRIAQMREYVDMANLGIDRVTAISRDLNAFARPGAGSRVAPVDEVLDLAIRLASNELRHIAQIERAAAPELHVGGDPGRLGQVFINLLVNAAQAMATVPDREHAIRIQTDRRGDDVVVTVDDTGPGIPPALQDRVFAPFFTTKGERGTGLGLAVCRKIVEDEYGGRLVLASTSEAGTTFEVWLPAAQPPAPVAVRADASVPQERRRVLIIDDEPRLAGSVARLLGRHEVEVITDASRALQRIEAGQRFDVVLCDVMMPRLSGVEFHRALRERDADQAARVVFLTGGVLPSVDQAYLERTKAPILMKPFGREQLLRMIEQATGGTTQGQAQSA